MTPQPTLVARPDIAIDRRWLVWGLGALTLFRLAAAGLTPLTEDEAYYRLWSLRPQFGYYDHPPMIAWWIWLGRGLVGDTALGVRLLPVLGATLTTLLLFDAARLAGFRARVAVRAGLWFNAALMIGVGCLLAVPDAPSTLFWMATLWSLLKARATGRPLWWLLAGAAAGLATLSKYSALFLAPGVLLWLVASPEGRAALRRPWPWLTAAVAVALFGLNVAWNAGHHWASFTKQFGRAVPHGMTLRYLGELLLVQPVLLNPLVAVFAWRLFDPAWLHRRGWDLGLFAATTAPFALYLVLHSLHDRVQQGWSAPLAAALALAAAVAAEDVRPGAVLDGVRRLAAPVGLGLGALALAYAASGLDLLGPKDPTLPLRGWPAFARAVEAARVRTGAAWVGTLSYGTAAQLAARPEVHAPVLQLDERERYVFLPESGADMAKPGLVVDLVRRDGQGPLKTCFSDVTAEPPLLRGPARSLKQTYAVWRVQGARADVQGGCSQ